MERYLREWRQEALNRCQYDTAIFVADKLLALTGDDTDVFWLAQVHFTTGNYSRTQALLARGDLIERNAQCRYLAAHCAIKRARFDDALALLGDKNPTHLVAAPGSARTKLRHVDVNVRAGARHAKTASRSDRVPTSEERDREHINNIRSEAGMCYLRGLCYAKQNSFDRAKECYKTAVQIDVQCFEAFDALMTNALLSPDEEWAFLDSLNFDTISVAADVSLSQEAAQFTRTLYVTRLSKYARPAAFTDAVETLSTHYNLADNPDILLAKADLLFVHCRFRAALALTASILAHDAYNFSVLPVHIACLYELGERNTLYLLAHELAESHPSEACTWFAVGAYYLGGVRIAEGRRFFSKASQEDAHFGPGWIGFAHTFAAEGEHDQAISAYSTAARLFQGSHLPLVFLGMQNLQLNNLALAREYLKAAYDLCEHDPLLLSEMGIVYFHEQQYADAIQFFTRALQLLEEHESDPQYALAIRTNLAHALRKHGRFEDALHAFDHVLRHGHRDPHVFTAKALVLLDLDRTWDAVTALHDALAAAPQDPLATDLLARALEINDQESGNNAWLTAAAGSDPRTTDTTSVHHEMANNDDEDAEMEHLERRMNGRLREIEQNRVAGRRGRRRRHAQGGGEVGAEEGESMAVDEE